jgi:hypothetical protein
MKFRTALSAAVLLVMSSTASASPPGPLLPGFALPSVAALPGFTGILRGGLGLTSLVLTPVLSTLDGLSHVLTPVLSPLPGLTPVVEGLQPVVGSLSPVVGGLTNSVLTPLVGL